MMDFAPFMRHAVSLAEKGRWTAAPNPTVGAVLVQNGQIVAEGWHAVCGQKHAEIACLDDARHKGVDPSLCTLFVTLEPCNHTGKTPPCAKAVLEAGIRHVVIGMKDPNPTAAGGAAFLAEHGVRVDGPVEERLCRDLVADFIVWQTARRPYVILKMAETIDGRIAARSGHSQWISCEESRREVHKLRAGTGLAGGAVLVGGNTLLADNPLLTARDVPVVRQPLACALSSRIPTKPLRLFHERPEETIFFTSAASAASTKAEALRRQGVRIIGLNEWDIPGGRDLAQMMLWLWNEAGCRYVLCEGGGTLGQSLLRAGLVDEFRLFICPKILGDNQASPLFDGRAPLTMDEALGMRIANVKMTGSDCCLTLRPLCEDGSCSQD